MSTPTPDAPLLRVRDLTVVVRGAQGQRALLSRVSLDLGKGEILGLVGESGSGKSLFCRSLVQLLPSRALAVTGGTAVMAGRDLLSLSEAEMGALRGAKIGMIFQNPSSHLDPVMRVGDQIAEGLMFHRKLGRKAAKAEAIAIMTQVGFTDPARQFASYPHEFSGGMRQRAMIAMAMALDPVLLVADEPTTALDVTVQAQVLAVMADLQREFGTAIILITHDLGVVAQVADDVVVMYAGSVMEQAPRRELFYRPHHPYTEGLLGSLPGQSSGRGDRLTPIPGSPPSLIGLGEGCPFEPRCPYGLDQCRTETPPLREVFDNPDHRSACWLPTDELGRAAARREMQARRGEVPA